MKRFVLAPDSFKGTMDAEEVCEIMRRAILAHVPDAEIQSIPVSDGGEGMVDSYLKQCGGRRVEAMVTGPLGRPVTAAYGLLPGGDTAVIEMAAAAGLPLAWGDVGPEGRNPMGTTTRGVGELVLHATKNGVSNIILGLGGSATNEGGTGMATALGYRFLDAQGQAVEPNGASLLAIARIEKPDSLPSIAVRAACDVDNPLCGANGAAHVFGPQKGASPQQCEELDAGLAHLAALIQRDLGCDVKDVPGAGAAGGLGAGVLAFLGGSLHSGIDMLLDAAGFDEMAKNADCVLTGEGKIDGQSVRGKVPVGVARRTKPFGIPCIALCGCIDGDIAPVYVHGITAVFASLRDSAPDFESMKQNSRGDMEYLADSVVRLLALAP